MNMNIDNCSNPWKDIASYEIADASCFKGREKAIKKFLDIIDNGAFSVLYSASGIGKTSFVQAGIEPAMMRENYVPVHVRFINDSIYKTKKERIEEEIINIIEDQLTKLGYSWTASFEKWPSDTYDEKGDSLQSICEKSLWWRFYTFKVTKGESETYYRPLFVFDQFEETFIKANKYHNSQFLISFFQIFEELSTPVLPIRIEKFMNILFDRGIRYKVKSVREFKVLFSLRKEYLSDFDNWTNDQFQISELLQNRMLLYPLSRSQAERVITQQPLIDINGNIVYGGYTETLIHVKDLILDKLDERHQNEIEPFLLSLLCSRLFDTAKINNQEELSPSDVDIVDMKTILKDFYEGKAKDIFKDQVKDLEVFEDYIIDEEGYRRRIKTTKFPNIDFSSYKKDLVDNHIVRIEKYSEDVEYVELVHDLLCQIIKERKDEREKISRIRKKNQQRVQTDLNVLTVRGRRLLDNTIDYGGFSNARVETPIDEDRLVMDSLFDFNLRYLFHSNVIIDDFINNLDNNHTLLLEYRNDNNEQVRSVDGVNKYELHFALPESERNGLIQNDKDCNPSSTFSTLRVRFIESIRTLSGYIDRPFYIQGYCGILVKYETYKNPEIPGVVRKREIERTYLDEYDNPIMTIDGYAMVKRHYDNNGNIDAVLFYDDKDKPQLCPHRNGNFGFTSKYDIYGREIERTFIDSEGKPKKVSSGICGRRFEYDSENRIIREINLGESQDIIKDKDGYCAVDYIYDHESRISDEIYLDENLKKMNGHDGFCITKTTYSRESDGTFIVEEKYYDKENNEVCVPITKSYINRYSYDMWFRPVKFEFLDNNKKAVYPALLLDYENFKLSKKTIQFGSQVFNQWIQLDKRNQYVEKMGRLNMLGGRVKVDGDYGKLFIRDERTHTPKGFLYLDKNGKPGSNDLGIYEQKWQCVGGKKISELYFDINEKPITDEIGVYGRRYNYNQNGDCVKKSFLGEDGTTIVNNKYGYAHIVTSYNEDYTKSHVRYLNDCDKTVPNENGDYSLKYEYSKENDFLVEKCISCGEKDIKHNNAQGICTHVEKKDFMQRVILSQDVDMENHVIGRIEKTDYYDNELKKEISYFDSDLRQTKGPDGWTRSITQYDTKGRQVYLSYYDENGNLFPDSLGDFGTRYEYPDDRVVRIHSLNRYNELYINSNGYAIKEITYDELGREIRIRYYGKNEERIIANTGRKGYIVKYLNDRSLVEICIDEFDESCDDEYGISRRIKELDKYGNLLSEYYYDVKGNPQKDIVHDYGTLYRYEDNKVFQIGLDQNGSPHKNRLGWVTQMIEGGKSVYLDGKNHKVGYFRQFLYLVINSFIFDKVKPINHLMIRMSVEQDGHFRKSGHEGYFLLLKYNKWSEGMPVEMLTNEFSKQNSESVDLEYVRLNLTFEGLTLGELYKRTFPTGKLGVRIKRLNLSEGLYRELMLMWKNFDAKSLSNF